MRTLSNTIPKMNSKQIKGLNVKKKKMDTIKPSEENTGRTLSDIN